MSYSLDANLLLYAVDETAPAHEPAARFLETCAGRDEPLCLTWPVINAFLRLSTDGRVFPRPLSPAQARAWLEDLMDLPQTRLLSEEPGFWRLYTEVAAPLNARGPTVTDIHIAAVLKQHGVRTLFTRDRDFRRFDFLKVVDPLARRA
jgi:toxin-antitoxin system PIN domain toxin